jgi:anti-anti-sigma factor
MEISIETKFNNVVVYISGRLDAANSSKLEEKLVELVDNKTTRLILNCEKLEYISSSGLRVFLLVLKKISSGNGKLMICSLSDSIREVFEISGFVDIFSIYKDEQEAINS